MAKMYNQLVEHHKEITPGTGGWNSCFIIKKQTLTATQQVKGGYAKKLRVNYILDDINSVDGGDSPRNSFPFGTMWAASLDDSLRTVDGEGSQLEPKHILDVTARNGGGGVVTLNLGHLIKENARDVEEGDGQIYIWMKATDITVDDTLVWRLYGELEGRWVTLTPL
jgi:hypothetical protein